MAKKKSIPGDEAAARLVSLYRDAEKSIAKRITKTMAQTDDKNRLKIRSLEQQQKAIKKVLKQLLSGTRAPVEEMIGDSFNGGLAVARKELKAAGFEDVIMEMNGINARAMKIYSDQVYSRMADVVQTSLRTVTDIYGALKLDSALGGAVGGYDAIGNVRRNLNKISEAKGITAFIDKSGRSWNMETYCEMLTRTATMQVFHQGKTNEYLAHGEDLVKVTTHEPTCEKCAPWGGKVLSLTGQTPGYPTLEEAKAAGLFHPSCRHTYALYIAEEGETAPTGAPDWKNISGDHSADADAKAVNPNYLSGEDQYIENCQRCVVAYEMRRRGFDVVAKPAIVNGKDEMLYGGGWKRVFDGADFITCPNDSGKQAISSMLEKLGDGACVQIIVQWDVMNGHAFIGENIKGKVHFIDPQTGDSDVETYFDHVLLGKTKVCRIDNLSTTKLVEKCCEERK